MSVGYHCQVIMVLPDPDIVAVMTARDFCPFRKLAETILVAVKSDSPLPASPEAAANLANAISDVATERPSKTGPVPELASTMSGKTYYFTRNALSFKSATLYLTDSNPHVAWEIYQDGTPERVIRTANPIGLDGLYRKNAPRDLTAPFAYRAMKGSWRDAQTFVVDLQFIGQGQELKWALSFAGDRVTITTKARDGHEVSVESEAIP